MVSQFEIRFFKQKGNLADDSIFIFSADWYKGILTDKQLDDLENPPTPSTSAPKAKKVSRRKHPKLQQRQQEQEEAEE